jgi:hypothetical protein
VGRLNRNEDNIDQVLTGKATYTVQRTDYATTATPVDLSTWNASMDAEQENTRPCNMAITPSTVRQLLKIGQAPYKSNGRSQAEVA